jgi:hypothetical protein
MTLEATTALMHRDADQAASRLRNELGLLASEEQVLPDWSSFRLSEVAEVVGVQGLVWYQWTGTVHVRATEAAAG